MLKLYARWHMNCLSKWKQIQPNFILKNQCNYKNYISGICTPSTIFALSSGHGKCGVSVVRVSGPLSSTAVKAITQHQELPNAREAVVKKLYHPQSNEQIDRGMVLWFPGPGSFTGEDSCEFQVHGGPAVVAAVLDALGHVQGLRPAEAGEFTKRAFQNEKLDLTAVEGLADLIHAETEAQRKQALRQMEGALAKLYLGWRERLIKITANIEAFIDFSEEENIEEGILSEVELEATALQNEIKYHLEDNRRGERLRNGVHVVIVGQPNVGKSSLLNAVCQRPAAIVSPIAGTTRDIIETALNIGGYPVLLSDTAGLHQTENEIESQGVQRAIERAQQADIKVLVLDAREHADILLSKGEKFEYLIISYMQSLGLRVSSNDASSTDLLIVFNKMDLVNLESNSSELSVSTCPSCLLSCSTEEGIEHFLTLLLQKIQSMCDTTLLSSPSLTQARHRDHLSQCFQALQDFEVQISQDLVLAAHSLRQALRQVGKVTGKVSSEEILDIIFKDFCIGK